jgi:NodT family efflux transporter outer membrane factor (OMF) lipoprotein
LASLGLIHAALLLSGCAVGPDFVPPAAPSEAGYVAGKLPAATASAHVPGGASQRLIAGRDVPGEWWKLFHSKQITALVDEAIANHPDIPAAEASLRQAREIAASDAGAFLPQASSTSSVTRQQTSAAQYGGSGSAQLYTLYNTNVAVSFTPDVFGKTERTVEADLASADYQRFQLEATYLSLTANVVATAIADASYAAQIRVTRDLIASYQAQLDLLEKRFALGAIGQADVLSERAQLAQAQATLPPLEKARAQTRNQLMAYLGRFPNADKGEAINLESLQLPKTLPLSLPSSLVRQRPDIRSIESQLHQASADIGVATANMLPQITLSASGGSQALSIDKFFGSQMAAWSVAGAVSGQIFDGGALFHKREARVASFEQAAAKYKSTVISAFQNVADALQAIKHDARTLRAQVLAETVAAQSLEIARAQYIGGTTTYSTVLNAEQTLLNARLNRVKAQAARFADTTALLQALGGGWWNRIDETPASQAKPTDLISTAPIAAAIRATMEDNQNAR